MIDELKLLKGDDFLLDDKILIHHPTLNQILEYGEKEYYNMVTSLCATPSDYKSILYDNFDIDYEDVKEFEFFLMMWAGLSNTDLSIIMPNITHSNFKVCVKNGTDDVGLYSEADDIFINDEMYQHLVEYIRKLHGFTKKVDKAGNETTKLYLIKKARKELKSQSYKEYSSTLAPLVSSMVNNDLFKYDHHTVWDLNIYQFMDSVKRIQKIKNVDSIMIGVYTGNVDSSKISKDSFDWLGAL